MNLRELRQLAQDLLDRHQPGVKTYQVEVNTRFTRLLGRVTYGRGLIEISSRIVGTTQAEKTLRHEVAHILDWERNRRSNHGYSWQRCALEVNASPRATVKGYVPVNTSPLTQLERVRLAAQRLQGK